MKRKQRIVLFAVLAVLMGVPLLMGIRDKALDIWAATENAAGTWIQVGEKWWYKHTDGSYTKSDWEKISNRWYYFDASGWMVTGWRKIDGAWYYLCKGNSRYLYKGERWTGWLMDGSRWYYLSPSKTSKYKVGQMATGWIKISGNWYYMNPTGAGSIYEGQMMTGWLTLSGKQYYLETNGVMQTGTVIMDGVKYTFSSSGALSAQENVAAPEGGAQIAIRAMQEMDTAFVWDGQSLETGCDNDGFLYCVLTACGYTVPETLAGQAAMGSSITRTSLQPGDVVIYDGDRELGAIYLGDNRVIYAASPRWGVRITNLDHPGEPVAYRRVW